MSQRDHYADALSYLFQAMGKKGNPMKAYWYHEGKTGEFEFTSLNQLTTFASPIPINAQLWVEPPQNTWGNIMKPLNQWYQVNARNRLVPVPIGVCPELRAALLLMGISP